MSHALPQEQSMISALPIEVLVSLTEQQEGKPGASASSGAPVPSTRSGHRLRVRLYEARDLPPATYFSSDKADTYAILALQGSRTRVTSKIVRESTKPTYNEAWDFHLSPRAMDDVLLVTLHATHVIGRDDFLGRVEIPLSMILSLPVPRRLESCWFKLLPDSTQFFSNDKRGQVRLGLEYFFDPSEGQLTLLRHQVAALAQLDSRKSVPSPNQFPGNFRPISSPSSPSTFASPPSSPPTVVPFLHPLPHPSVPPMPRHPEESASTCPVCNQMVPAEMLASHVDAHFANPSSPSHPAPPTSAPLPPYTQSAPRSETFASAPPPPYFPYPPTITSVPPPEFQAFPPLPLPSEPSFPPQSLIAFEASPELEEKQLAQALRESAEMANLSKEKYSVGQQVDSTLTEKEIKVQESLADALARRNSTAPPSSHSPPSSTFATSSPSAPAPLIRLESEAMKSLQGRQLLPLAPPPPNWQYSQSILYPSVSVPLPPPPQQRV